MALREFNQIINDIEQSNKLNILDNNNIVAKKDTLEIEVIDNKINEFFKNYNPFKICGITFCKIGRNLGFNFDENYIPKFVIGPHWYLFLLMNIIIILLSVFLYRAFIKISSDFMVIGYFISLSLILICYYLSFLLNPGLVLNKISNEENCAYCSICNVYYNLSKKVHHCNFCNVCIEGFDHHCVWVGKCIGKKNIIPFYGIMVFVGITYTFIIISFILLYLSKT